MNLSVYHNGELVPLGLISLLLLEDLLTVRNDIDQSESLICANVPAESRILCDSREKRYIK